MNFADIIAQLQPIVKSHIIAIRNAEQVQLYAPTDKLPIVNFVASLDEKFIFTDAEKNHYLLFGAEAASIFSAIKFAHSNTVLNHMGIIESATHTSKKTCQVITKKM